MLLLPESCAIPVTAWQQQNLGRCVRQELCVRRDAMVLVVGERSREIESDNAHHQSILITW